MRITCELTAIRCTVLLTGLALAGCEPTKSVYPYYTKEAVVTTPTWLLGTWIQDGPKAAEYIVSLTFARDSLTFINRKEETELKFDATYFVAGNTLFVDVALSNEQWDGNPELGFMALPVHFLLRPERISNRMAGIWILSDESQPKDAAPTPLYDTVSGVALATPEQWMSILDKSTVFSERFEELYSDLWKVGPASMEAHANAPYAEALEQLAYQRWEECRAVDAELLVEDEPRPDNTADFNEDGIPDPIISNWIFRCFNEEGSFGYFGGGSSVTRWTVMISRSDGGYEPNDFFAKGLTVVYPGDLPVLLQWVSGVVCGEQANAALCVIASVWNGERFVHPGI